MPWRRLCRIAALTAGLALLSGAASAQAALDRVALVIGNGSYRHAAKLANPTNDSSDIAQVLRGIGFDVVQGNDLDKRAMEDKVREFSRKLDGAKVALFFYAGHGMQVAGKNYLLPIDAKLERPGDLDFETIDISLVMSQMEGEKRVNLVFLDACRDNPLARSFAPRLGTRSAAVGRGLASIQSAVGTLIAFATQPEAVALDGSGRNSPFTAALLKHMAEPGIDISVMMRRVRNDVLAATAERQVPWDHSSLTDEVILVPGAGPRVAALPPPISPSATSAAETQPLLLNHAGWVFEVAFSPDGRIIATAGRDTTIKLWDANSGALLRTLHGHSERINQVAFSRNGDYLASAGNDGVKLWQAASGAMLHTLSSGGASKVSFTPDGAHIAISQDLQIKTYEVNSAKLQRSYPGLTTVQGAFAVSPDGRNIALVANDPSGSAIRIIDTISGRVVRSIALGAGVVPNLLTYSADGRLIATEHGERINLWEAGTGKLIRTLEGHAKERQILGLALSPDARWLASGGCDATIRIWDTESGRVVRTLRDLSNNGCVNSVAFSADGKRIASTGSVRDGNFGVVVRSLSETLAGR
jgi:WD40 repeat protein